MATQAERREATRAAILAAAKRFFRDHGFAATSVDQIAAEAKVAKGAVYHHFATKEAVFEAVFEDAAREIVAHVSVVSRKAPDVLKAMAAGTRAYYEACAKPGMAQIMLHDGPAVLGWGRWREIDERYFGRMIPQALKAAMAQGLLLQQPVEPLARLLNGAVTEAAVACAASDNATAAGRRYAVAFQTLIEGLRR